jgi:hypothetical protein
VTATMTATQATYTGGPLVADAAGRLRSPLAEVVARCAALNDAAELLADLLADDPQVLLMLIQAHLLRAQKTHRL